MGVNCYIVADVPTGEACIIDPGAEPNRIKECLRSNNFTPNFIINTHGHGDHIAANGAFDVPILIHRLDAEFLKDPVKNMSKFFIFSVTSPKASRLLEDGEVLTVGDLSLSIMHTPGHTPGSVSIGINGIVFTGDALFEGSIGRTDFPYGDEAALLRSIKEKLLTLSDDTIVYPGHGGSSTIGTERKDNPFLI
jgi:glyoxylase-like metal-dependent hydrolase (beta-lactamase superfamily II)